MEVPIKFRPLVYLDSCAGMATQNEGKKLGFKTNYHLMQVKSIAECFEHSAILLSFIKLPFVIKTFVLSVFEWPHKTGSTVLLTPK